MLHPTPPTHRDRGGTAMSTVESRISDALETIEALAEQNRLLKEALLKLACLGHGESYGNSIGNCIAQDALAVPDLSTSILNQRDARTLREAAEWFYKFGKDQESEPDIAAAQQLERMAAEKEKA